MEQKPWLSHYDAGVPATLIPYPEITFLDVLADTVKQRPNHPSMYFKGNILSYGDLDQLSNDLAAALMEMGVKKGDRVALILPNSPQAVIGQFGIWKAGAINVPMNPTYADSELEHALNECGAEIAVVLTLFYNKVKAMQSKTKVKTLIATNIKDYLSPVLGFLFTLLKEKKEGYRITLQGGDVWWNDIMKKHAGSSKPDVKVSPGDKALFLFSGGTTGVPKGAIGTHQGMVMSGMQLHAWFGVILKDWDDILVQVLPLFHVYGNVGVLATALIGHSPVALVPNPRDMKDLISTIKKVKPTFMPAVPALFVNLLKHPDIRSGKVHFKSMKLCISGAAPLLQETKKNFEALTGGRVVEGYALTETMMGAIVNPILGTYKPGSIGLPVTDIEVRIADPVTGEGSMPPGEIGEILVKAPQMMKEYWQRPDETAKTIRDGWMLTGDLGFMDKDGYIFIVDRKKDLVKISGYQVWPREVEEVIATHPAVSEVCVAGVPDATKGELLKAWIVLNKDKQATAEEIQAHCQGKLSGYKIPRLIEFRDSLPKTLVGKTLRRALVEEYKKKMAEAQK
jgi:long-chain acyl-CoA synthetase